MAYIKTVQELINVLESLDEKQKQMMVYIDDDYGLQTIDYVEEHDEPFIDERCISLQSENCSTIYPNSQLIWPNFDKEKENE